MATLSDIIFTEVEKTLYISRDQFDLAIEGLEIIPIEKFGQLIGAILIKDGEFHITVLEDYRGKWVTKELMRRFIVPGAKTSVEKDSPLIKYLDRLGFEQVGEDEYDFHYELRRTPCQLPP